MRNLLGSVLRWVVLALVALFVLGCASSPPPSPTAAASPPKPAEAAKPAEPAKAVQPTAAPAAKAAPPFVIGLYDEPDTLDPSRQANVTGRGIAKNIYETLVDYEKDEMVVKPALAESWQVSPDGKQYTFQIRKGVRFTDGTPLTAEAVKLGLERTIRIKKFLSDLLQPIETIEAPSEQVLRISLRAPNAWFLHGLIHMVIVSPTAAKQNQGDDDGQKYFHNNAVGTGPYKLERWDAGQQIVLTRNPDYWRGWSGQHLDRIVARVIKESSTQRLMLEKGDLDVAQLLTTDDIPTLQKNADLVVDVRKGLRQLGIMMRIDKGPTKDVKVREAIRYAIDYDGHNKGAMQGLPQASVGPFPPEMVGGVPGIAEHKRDMEKARQLLREAGYPNGGFSLVFSVQQADEDMKIGQIVQANLAELGIKVEVQADAAAQWSGKLRNPDTAAALWKHYVTPRVFDPDSYLYYIYHSSSLWERGNNWMGYSNPKVDSLLDQGRATLDAEKRNQIYREVAKILEDDVVAARVNRSATFQAFRKWVKGYYYKPLLWQSFNFYEMWLEGKSG